jgi:hypothetical protein
MKLKEFLQESNRHILDIVADALESHVNIKHMDFSYLQLASGFIRESEKKMLKKLLQKVDTACRDTIIDFIPPDWFNELDIEVEKTGKYSKEEYINRFNKRFTKAK